jgi:hypothetical protein
MSSTFKKFEGDGFILYEIADPYGPRGTVRIDCDGGLQLTPHSEMGCSAGTMWLTPEDEAYAEVMAHLQKVAATGKPLREVLPEAVKAQGPLQLEMVAG